MGDRWNERRNLGERIGEDQQCGEDGALANLQLDRFLEAERNSQMMWDQRFSVASLTKDR